MALPSRLRLDFPEWGKEVHSLRRDEFRRNAGLPKYTELNADDVRKLWQSGEGKMKNPVKRQDDKD